MEVLNKAFNAVLDSFYHYWTHFIIASAAPLLQIKN